jgi:hypothetical protein
LGKALNRQRVKRYFRGNRGRMLALDCGNLLLAYWLMAFASGDLASDFGGGLSSPRLFFRA